MTDEEEARVRELISMEVQARILKVRFIYDRDDIEFCSDMRSRYPRAYRRISDSVLAQYNITRKQIEELINEQERRKSL